jgi:hypothetical protein
MTFRTIRLRWALLVLPLLLSLGVAAQVTLVQFEQALHAIPVSNTEFILAAIKLGMPQDDFPDAALLRLIERLTSRSAAPFEKEAVLMVVARALQDGLPVEGLINKALEGLARGISLELIEQDLSERLVLLSETRDLLYAKGIFSAPAGGPQTVPTAIPALRFNQLLINISETIGDFLEGGGSPFEGAQLYQEVRNRLMMLQGVTLLPADVELVLDRIEPSDLTQVALAAVS